MEEIKHGEAHRRLLVTLADIQKGMGDNLLPNSDQDFPTADGSYAQAFAEFGVDLDRLPPQESADRLRKLGDAFQAPVAAALDDWGYVRFVLKSTAPRYPRDNARLHQASRLLDPDPVRNRIRDAVMGRDEPALARLAAELDPAGQPAQTCNWAGTMLYWLRPQDDFSKATAFLRRAQGSHPGDFQINHNLAFQLVRAGSPDEAEPYARVSLALRPGSATAHQAMGHFVAALDMHQRLIAIAPHVVRHHFHVGNHLEKQGEAAEARDVFRRSVVLVARHHPCYDWLLAAWRRFGLVDEAVAAYRAEIALHPDKLETREGLCRLLADNSRWREHVQALQEIVLRERGPERSASAQYLLGIGLRNAADIEGAVAALKRGAEALPGDPPEARPRRC